MPIPSKPITRSALLQTAEVSNNRVIGQAACGLLTELQTVESQAADPQANRREMQTPPLKALTELRRQGRLNRIQQTALGHLQSAEHHVAIRSNNGDVNYPLRDYIEAAMPHIKNDPIFKQGLQRTASFMLIRPVCEDVKQNLSDKADWYLTRKFSLQDRMLITAQVDALKNHIETFNRRATDAALRGERCAPLSLQKTAFNNFLCAQQPVLQNIVSACTLSGTLRREALIKALKTVAEKYLHETGSLPTGLKPGETIKEGAFTVDHSRISLLLPDQEYCGSAHRVELTGDAAIIFVAIDGLDDPLDDPCRGTPRSKMYVEGLEDFDIPQKQAAVFLQKLLMELVNLEEHIYVVRHAGKDGMPINAAARATKIELEYQGTTHLGDNVLAPNTESAIPSRMEMLATFNQLRLLAENYQQTHDESLLTDPDLDKWLQSTTFRRDAMSLIDPPSRMKLALLPITATALRENGFLSEQHRLEKPA
ncbi:MAG: hypothetical protein V4695_06455 [Pseudomonadota bacterium]